MATKVNGLIQRIDPGNGTQYSLASTAYGYCETAAATPTKVVDMTGFTLIEGTTIHVKFKEKNSASNPKLNVNGTGEKAIVQYGSTAVGTADATSGWYAGAVVSFTYDGTNWVRDQGFNTDANTTYSFDGTYNSSSNKAATVSSITTRIATAIEGLDGNITGTAGAGATITALDETNGIVTATFAPISITKSQITDFPTSMTPTSHTHGNIQNGGTLQTNDITIANGDKLVVTDASDSNKVARASISFDGTTTTQALTKAGTWVTFNNYSHPTTTAVSAAAVKVGKDSTGHVVIGDALTAADVGVSATTTSVTVGSTTFSKYTHPTTAGNKHIPSGGQSGQILRWSADGTAAWGSDNDTKYTAGSGLSLSTGNQFSISTGGVTNAMLAGSIANEKLTNSKVTIAGNDVSLGGSLSAATLKSSLGLNSALHYIGKTTTELSDGSTTSTISIGGSNVTATSGDIVIDNNSNYEYIWNGDAWEAFGPEGSYKVRQEAVTDPTAGTSGQINFIATISQNENGEISATKQPVRSASTSQTGVLQFTAANTNAQINTLTTGSATPTDNDYFISQYAGGGTNTTTYHRRPISTLYTYITNKLAISNAGATLSWGSAVKVATIGGTDINVSLPSNPNTDRYVNNAAFADVTSTNASNPVKMTLTRAGSDTQTITANIPKVSSSSAGVAPKGAAVSTQSQSTKFLREDGTWAAPSYTVNTNTDTLVKQTAKTDNTNYKILFTTSASPTSGNAAEAAYDADITINPSTNTITATTFAGKATSAGTADSANAVAWGNVSGKPDTYPPTIGTTATTAAAGNHTHATTLATDTGTSTITLAYGGKYKLSTGGTNVIFTMPSDSNVDTKVNVVARGTTKAYILGDTTSPTSSAAAHTAVAETAVYMDTTAGAVAATSYKVAEKVILQYNTTTDALDFVFI